MPAKVTILILNWNGKNWLEQFLPSVMATEYADYHVLVADNGSTDDSVEFLRSQYPTIEVAELGANYGFTGGNNRALKYVHTPYYVLLNSDVEVTPGWLGPLVELMEANPDVASAQPKIRWWRDRGKFEYAGAAGGYMDKFYYPFNRGRIFESLETDEGQYDDDREIFWATGACCIIRKSVSDKIGLFEEEFFAHWEEIDFCWRARRHGYKIMYTGRSTVFHVGGGTLQKENPRKTYLNARNSLASLIRNLPMRELWYKLFIRLCLDGVWGVRSLLKGQFRTLWAIFTAHFAVHFRIGFWWKKRRAIARQIQSEKTNRQGYYPRSVVWQHFARGVKRFSDLKW